MMCKCTMCAEARAQERAAIVAWLRDQRQYGTADLLGQGYAVVCECLAGAIETGAHLTDGNHPDMGVSEVEDG